MDEGLSTILIGFSGYILLFGVNFISFCFEKISNIFRKEKTENIEKSESQLGTIQVSKDDGPWFDVKAKKYCNCAVSSKKQHNHDLTLEEIRKILKTVDRSGAEKDNPEGSKIVIMSKTLAWQIIDSLDFCIYEYEEMEEDIKRRRLWVKMFGKRNLV